MSHDLKFGQIITTDLLPIVEATACNLWMAAVEGASARPEIDALYKRMRKPQVGDWVFEFTSYRIRKVDRRGFGILESIDGDPLDHTTKFLIRLPNGELMEWTNAMMIAIPAEVHDWFPRR